MDNVAKWYNDDDHGIMGVLYYDFCKVKLFRQARPIVVIES